MKKFILFFFTLFMSVNIIFGFEVFDNNGISKSYFSLNDYQVSLKSLQNESPLSIMVLGSPSTLRNYNFVSCSVEYCYDFSLVDYMTGVGLVLNSTEFVISAGGTSKSIYFDSEKPTFSLENSIVDSQNKLLKLYFTFSDDYNVDFVEVFEVKSSGIQSFGQVSSNSFDFPLVSEGIVTLRFKVTDGAGNFQTFDFDFEVLDLFAPVISDVFVVKNNAGLFNLEFSGSDSNLQKYEIVQNDLKVTGVLSGTSFTKNINLPFTSGKIILTLFDSLGNSKSKTISLSPSFDIEIDSEFSNEDEFIFESDAKSCEMISIDSRFYDDRFSEDDDEFSVDLDLNSDGSYELTFYCEDSIFGETFIRDFTYDTGNPSESILSLSSDNDGFIKLIWTQSKDLISDVSYELFRDDKRIYSGSRENYLDEEVLFSENYEYYLEISDEAGNSLNSNVISGSPNKVFVELSSSILGDEEVTVSEYVFNVDSEIGADTSIIVKKLGKEFFSETISSSNGRVDLELVQGVNEIIITSVDEFDNKNVLRYFITYNKPIPVIKKVEPPVISIPETPIIKDLSGDVVASEVDNLNSGVNVNKVSDVSNEKALINASEDNFNWFLWLGLIFVLVILIYIFIVRENKIPGHLDTIINKNIDKKNKENSNNKKDNHHFKRDSDNVLHKHIRNVKAERKSKLFEKKRDERLAKIESLKPKRELSKIEKLKLNNLTSRNKFDFNVSYKKPNENYKMKPEPVIIESENEEVFKEGTPVNDKDMEIKLKKKPSLFGFFKKQKIEPTEKEVEDEKFLGYIGKQRENKSWDKIDLYRQSHFDKIAAKKLEKLKAIEDQKRMELQAKQLELDEQNKKLAKIAKAESDKAEFDDHRKIARATMDEYLAGKAKKRSFWFAEKAVSKDIKSRK